MDGQFAHDDLQFAAQSTVGVSTHQSQVHAGTVSDIGVCLQVGGRVEPLGDLPLGSKEGAAAQGEGSYHQNQTHDTTYQGYLRWVAQQQGQLLQQQHQQQQSHRQQQQQGQQQQRQEVRQFQQQQWTGVAGGAPPSHLSTQQQQHSRQQQQWGGVAGGTPSSNHPTQNQQYGFTSGVQTLESAGVSASSLGIQGNFGNLFTEDTHDRGMIQDADWLSRIKYLTDVGKRKRSSNWLRPDHHIEMDKRHEDMSFLELWYGMNCVRDRIRKENLQELRVEDYDAHMRFVSLKAQVGQFPAKALAMYDHKVVSSVMDGSIPKFIAGYEEAVNCHLSAEHLSIVETLVAQKNQGNSQQHQGSKRRRRQGGGGGPRFDQRQDQQYPSICKKWNFMLCDYADCRWAHICWHCNGGHKGKDCSLDRNNVNRQRTQPTA